MKFEPDSLLLTADSGLSPHRLARAWRPALPIMAAAILAILSIYADTAKSIVAIWRSSDTFAHGYLIVPITLVLVWVKRREVAALAPRPDALGFLLLAAAGFAWLAAEAAQVQVLAQYALLAMVCATVLALCGRRVAWTLAFPLAFLLLAVPFGEAFLPWLMEWTADFTVAALRISAIPLFLALSVAVPIVANFFRAYAIVMIGHLSGMKLAVGIDHFIYGWLFFGVVIGLLFWLGSLWREPALPASPSRVFLEATSTPPAAMLCAAIGTVGLAAVAPLYLPYLDRAEDAPIHLAAPAAASGWSLEPQSAPQWRPQYRGAAASTLAVYRKGDRRVAVYVAYYRNQRQGEELVGSQNLIAGAGDSPWARIGESPRSEELPIGRVELRQTRLRSAAGRLLVWDWYRVAGHDLSNPFMAKALLARDKLLRRGDDCAAIVLAAPYEARPETAVDTLRVFTREMLPAIDDLLRAAVARGAG
jgi:EpsI family protein